MSEALPVGWHNLKFGELFERLVNGGTPATGSPRFWNGRTPWVTGADFTPGGIGEVRRFVSDAGIRSSATSVVKAGNIVVVTRTGVGKLAIAPFDLAISQDITGLYVDGSKADTAFVFYLLSRELAELKKLNQGTSINGIIRADLEKHPVRIPVSKTAQRKIAAILTSLDTAIEKTEALIEKHQQIKAGLMHDLFTRGILPNGQLRPPWEQAPELYRQTPLGWLPADWGPSNCGRAFTIDSGITLGPHRWPRKHAHPYIRVANLHRDEIRMDDVATLEALPSDADRVLKRFDLLVVEGHANTAEIGRCAMVDGNAEGLLFQNHLFRLRALETQAAFALLWLNSHHVQRYWGRACATSSGLNTINRTMLKAAPFYVPSDAEQSRITDAVSSSRRQIRAQSTKLEKLRAQKLGLMQDLLTGKVSVKRACTEVPA